jgi:hypothetical protein
MREAAQSEPQPGKLLAHRSRVPLDLGRGDREIQAGFACAGNTKGRNQEDGGLRARIKGNANLAPLRFFLRLGSETPLLSLEGRFKGWVRRVPFFRHFVHTCPISCPPILRARKDEAEGLSTPWRQGRAAQSVRAGYSLRPVVAFAARYVEPFLRSLGGATLAARRSLRVPIPNECGPRSGHRGQPQLSQCEIYEKAFARCDIKRIK